MRLLRTGLLLLALLVTEALCTSCNTPTLPIPPPATGTYCLSAPDTASCPLEPSGIVTVHARREACPDRAPYLMVFNETTMLGVYSARLTDFTFAVRIPAAVGDYLDLACMTGAYEVGLKTTSQLVNDPSTCTAPP
jgi:hypothetical protein